MIVDELRNREKIAYQTIGNSLSNKKVAHSYLFSGEFSPLKIETAYLLAQSIIEGKNDWACQNCVTCKRIRNNEYFDVIYIDGYKASIKKDDIERIMTEFNKTSLEESGKKVYILANINNSSIKVLNMILKFMEEPSNEDTYGIFITDKKEDLLPTIISRCLEVPFLTRDFSFLISQYTELGFAYLDAYLLSHIKHCFDINLELNDPYYLSGKDYVYKTIEALEDKEYIEVLFNSEFYVLFKDRDDFKKLTDYYLAIMLKMLEDSTIQQNFPDEDYDKHLAILRNYNVSKLWEIFIKAADKLEYNVERKLLFDSIAQQIILYI